MAYDKDQLKCTLGITAKDIIISGINPVVKGSKISCPYHGDKHPSMSWYEDGNLFKCMTCNETLDIYRYYMEYENMDFKEAVDKVGLLVGETPLKKKVDTKKTYKKATENYGELSENTIEEARNRGIKKSTLESWEVQTAKVYGKEWFAFRYRDERNKIVFNTFRQLGDKICQREKDTKSIAWGIDKIDVKKPVIIVEGQFDAMAIWQSGYKNVISIPSGINEMSWIENSWSWIQKIERFVIWSDSDDVGLKGAEEIRNRIGKEKVFVDYNVDSKDANDLMLKGGAKAVLEFVDDLLFEKVDGLINMGRRKNVDKPVDSFYSGFYEIDKHFRKLAGGSLTLVFGRDNEGKSTFVSQMIATMLKKEKVFLYSGELTDDNIELWLMRQLLGRQTGVVDVSYDEWENKIFNIKPEVKKGLRQWYRDKFFVYENKIEMGKESKLFDVMEMGFRKHGIKIFVVDNMMSAVEDGNGEENAIQTNFVKKCKQFALAFGVLVVVVAHPNKTGSTEHTPLQKVHVAGSKNITNIADNVIAVERVWESESNELDQIYMKSDSKGLRFSTIVRCLKDRVSSGRKDLFFHFDLASNRFYNDLTPQHESYGWECLVPKKMKVNNYDGSFQEIEYKQMDIDPNCPF